MLGLAQQDVAGDRAFEPRLEAAGVVQQDQRLALVRQPVHQGRRDQHVAEAHEAADVMQRDAQPGLPLHLDAHGGVVQVHIGLGGHDVEGVLDAVHVPVILCEIGCRLRLPAGHSNNCWSTWSRVSPWCVATVPRMAARVPMRSGS